MLADITPLLITHNEERNIRRTVERLLWAKRVVVVDSGSQDKTLSILASYSQVDVFHRVFTDFASQCNYGLTQITSAWVLSLDADYELSDDLIAELSSLKPSRDIGGYRARFIYRIHGRPLRGSLYPPRVVLYRTSGAVYRNEGHGHRVSVSDTVRPLSAYIFHDDRKPLAHWLASQQRYAAHEAAYLLCLKRSELSSIDRVRLVGWPAPVAVAVYTLFVKGCVLDGWPGWFYVLQRVLAEVMLALEILDRRLTSRH